MPGTFSATSFRILGAAATPQNLLTIKNLDPTALLRIRDIMIQMDPTAALTAVMPLIKVSRAAAVPSGGTVLSKAQFDTANASNANTFVRGGNAADGGAATAIVATAGTTIWQEYQTRLHTVAGQVLAPPSRMPTLLTKDLVLRQNQALLVQVVAAVGTSNPATNNWVASIVWDES